MANPIGALTFYLNQGIGGSDTSIAVRGLKNSRGTAILAMPSGATLILATIEPNSATNQEHISFTGITDNGNGVVTLTGVTRNLNPEPPYTAGAANVSHGNGSSCILSNSPSFYNTFLQSDVASSISAVYTFLTAFRPKLSADADTSTPETLITYGQLLRTALGTTFPYGTVVAGTAGENVSVRDVVYLDHTTQKWFLAKANDLTKLNNRILGIVGSTTTTNNVITGGVLLGGYKSGYSGLTVGIVYTNDSGVLSSTVGTNSFAVGVATSATEIVFDPTMSKKLTQNEKDGLTSAFPSIPYAVNPVVTADALYTNSGLALSQLVKNADVVFGEADATTKRFQLAQQFTATKSTIASITVARGTNIGTPTGNVVIDVYADTGNVPSGGSLGTVTILLATWNAVAVDGDETFTFATPISGLTPNSKYWFKLTNTVPSNTNTFSARKQSTDVYTGGSPKYNNTTDGWVAEAGDLYFKINQSPRNVAPMTDPATGLIPASFFPQSVKFGGNGSDGALSISSGTTNIDCAGAQTVTKNYTSISITGTGKLTFTNPHANGTIIILKSQGNVTLTASATIIDASAMGAIAGTGNGLTQAGNGVLYGSSIAGGQFGLSITGGTGGVGASSAGNYTPLGFASKLIRLACGGGGGGSAGGSNSGQVSGGRGGGALLIECGGSWNFTTASGISVAGQIGFSSTGGNNTGGGGGGGGGGSLVVLYNALTANSGTVVIAGGAGGTGSPSAAGGTAGNGTGGSGNGGAGGSTSGNGGGGGGGGASDNGGANGNGGVAGAGNGSGGGGGASGYSLVTANTYFY